MKWCVVLLTVAACALAPLVVDPAWAQFGAFPDFAVIVVIYLAAVSTPERAAAAGMIMGFAACPWTVAPVGQQAFLLGVLGFGAGRLNRWLYRDRVTAQMALVLVSVFLLRAVEAVLAEMSVDRAAGSGGSAGFRTLTVVRAAGLAAVASAILSPLLFAILAAAGLLQPLEVRRPAVYEKRRV